MNYIFFVSVLKEYTYLHVHVISCYSHAHVILLYMHMSILLTCTCKHLHSLKNYRLYFKDIVI